MFNRLFLLSLDVQLTFTMDIFTVITILVTLSALFSYVNVRYIKLPGTIGIMAVAIMASVLLLITARTFPQLTTLVVNVTREIDFSKTLLDVMLGFLLFAGALHFDINKLKEQRFPVLLLSTAGVILSTAIFGYLLYWVSGLLKIELPLLYCLLFGALISPTDPVAVGSILKKSKIPAHLETIISGESLFNDGVGLVLFVTILEIISSNEKNISFGTTMHLFAQEVFGGILLGLILGLIAYRMMRSINEFQTIVIISLALVMGISVVGSLLHVSIPLAVVGAGLFVGARSNANGSSTKTEEYFESIWKLIDELLNIILFVMIGLQLVIMPFLTDYWLIGLVTVILLLTARTLSIVLPIAFLRRTLKIQYNSIFILTWGGLRGGISVALALSLPESEFREPILACSFLIVIFSIIVQGLTLNKVVNLLAGEK